MTQARDRTRGGQTSEEVYRTLRKAILDGTYRPAQHLVEQILAEDLNTSKTPIREALARLKEEGLVESFPYRGYFIKTLSGEDLAEIYELRELYEGACARTAAASGHNRELANSLREANDAAERALAAGEIDVVHMRFAEFDEILFAQTTNRRLQEQIERIGDLVYLAGVLTNRIPGRIQKSISQHRGIIEAISQGDPVQAEQRTREHIRSLCQDELQHRPQGHREARGVN